MTAGLDGETFNHWSVGGRRDGGEGRRRCVDT